MGGWVDGCMNEWMGRWVGGWVSGWGRWVAGWMATIWNLTTVHKAFSELFFKYYNSRSSKSPDWWLVTVHLWSDTITCTSRTCHSSTVRERQQFAPFCS